MSETVVLTGRCNRRRHVLYRVLDADSGVLYRVTDAVDGLMVESSRYCTTPDRDGWTPLRRELMIGKGTRYGCSCGRTALVTDADMWRDICNGARERVEACYSLG